MAEAARGHDPFLQDSHGNLTHGLACADLGGIGVDHVDPSPNLWLCVFFDVDQFRSKKTSKIWGFDAR